MDVACGEALKEGPSVALKLFVRLELKVLTKVR